MNDMAFLWENGLYGNANWDTFQSNEYPSVIPTPGNAAQTAVEDAEDDTLDTWLEYIDKGADILDTIFDLGEKLGIVDPDKTEQAKQDAANTVKSVTDQFREYFASATVSQLTPYLLFGGAVVVILLFRK